MSQDEVDRIPRIQCSCIDMKKDRKYDIITAVKSEHVECVEKLIAQGCYLEVTLQDPIWSPPCGALRTAVSSGNIRIVKVLLKAGINVNGVVINQRFRDGINRLIRPSPLVAACLKKDMNMIKVLIESGADPNPEPNTLYNYGDNNLANEPPLWSVACSGMLDAVKLLVTSGASINLYFRSSFGESGTALYRAACAGQPEIVEYLIDNDADLSIRAARGKTPLMGAADCFITSQTPGQAKCIQIFLKAGSDIHAKSTHGMTALEYAARENNRMIMEILLAANAQINDPDTDPHKDFMRRRQCVDCNDRYENCRDIHLPVMRHILKLFHHSMEHDISCINLAYAAGAKCPESKINKMRHYATQYYGWDEENINDVFMLRDQGKMLSLTDICRNAIREHMIEVSLAGAEFNNLFIGIPMLPLPASMKDYLLFCIKLQSPWEPLPDPPADQYI